MRKFESSQKDESRAQSADSSKAYRKRRVFYCNIKLCLYYWTHSTLTSTSASVCFRGISRLPSAFVFLRWFKLTHISIQVCTFHDGCKQGIDQQNFKRKSISRKITHPQSLLGFYLNKDWGCVILREIDFLLKICWSIPCLHPSWKVHTSTHWSCWWIHHFKKPRFNAIFHNYLDTQVD